MAEAVNDNGLIAGLAAHPKQPFDIAGRTGTVTFDVSNNTQGVHAAWPAFALTDQPVPAPYGQAPGTVATYARNSLVISFAQRCDAGAACGFGDDCVFPSGDSVAVDSMSVTRNYALEDLNFTPLGCVKASESATSLNHFEVHLSPQTVQVYGTDAGTSAPLKLLAEADDANLPLTRGLIWIEDVHYNGDKFNTQRSNTFAWDNVGFDGPILSRDVTFDVLDNLSANSDGTVQLGWVVPTASETLTLKTMPLVNVYAASAALVTFNWFSQAPEVPSLSVNDGPLLSTPWPFENTTYVWRTLAVSVPLAQLKTGVNIIRFQAPTTAVVIANVDIILVGAGGVPTASPQGSRRQAATCSRT